MRGKPGANVSTVTGRASVSSMAFHADQPPLALIRSSSRYRPPRRVPGSEMKVLIRVPSREVPALDPPSEPPGRSADIHENTHTPDTMVGRPVWHATTRAGRRRKPLPVSYTGCPRRYLAFPSLVTGQCFSGRGGGPPHTTP